MLPTSQRSRFHLAREAQRPRFQVSKESGIVDLGSNNSKLIFCLERCAPRWTAAMQRRSLSSFYIRKDGVHLLVVSLNVGAQSIAARCAIARHSCPRPRPPPIHANFARPSHAQGKHLSNALSLTFVKNLVSGNFWRSFACVFFHMFHS